MKLSRNDSKPTEDESPDGLKIITFVTSLYIVPIIINMTQAVQTQKAFFAVVSFIPIINIISGFMCIGEIIYRYLN